MLSILVVKRAAGIPESLEINLRSTMHAGILKKYREGIAVNASGILAVGR
jgi:hypothetical protein